MSFAKKNTRVFPSKNSTIFLVPFSQKITFWIRWKRKGVYINAGLFFRHGSGTKGLALPVEISQNNTAPGVNSTSVILTARGCCPQPETQLSLPFGWSLFKFGFVFISLNQDDMEVSHTLMHTTRVHSPVNITYSNLYLSICSFYTIRRKFHSVFPRNHSATLNKTRTKKSFCEDW